MSLIFFDFESGGLLPHQPEIQLAAIAVSSDWKELESGEWKIQFDEAKADPEALKLNHYDRKAWADYAVPETKAVQEFGQFLKRHASIQLISKRTGNPYSVARLAGHNAVTFDGPRLKAMFERQKAFLPAHPIVMDTLQFALWESRRRGMEPKSFKLGDLCEALAIPFGADAHDALYDVRASIALAKGLMTMEVAA